MMLSKSCVNLVFLLSCLFSLPQPAWSDDSGFRGVLEIAGLKSEILAKFSDAQGPPSEDWQAEDWRLLIQLLHRINKYPESQQTDWARDWGEKLQVGDLVDVVGTVESVDVLTLPEPLAQTHGLTSIYRCQFRFKKSAENSSNTVGMVGTVLSASIPSDWKARDTIAEPIRFRGILLREGESQPGLLFLTPRLAWFPRQGVSTGKLLLARHGMDVALLEEVRHGKPFVGPEVSREGKAFYACLAAMSRVDSGELSTLSRKSVAQLANHWRESNATDRQQQAIAAQVLKRGELGLSSVAPLFLQPKLMTGRLVRIEGTARRAVRIAVADRPEMDSYFELEIFPPDSQNHPIVCCVKELPKKFPTGDTIREPVRMAGVFFKGWLYRGREVQQTEGQTSRQQRLYTPVVVGAVEWLPRSTSRGGRWGLWGGIAFLVVLMVVSLNAVRLARKDRRTRATRRDLESVNLPKN